MDTRQIEYMLAISQEKSITKAAQKLYITQPTLSQALLKLEQELGQPLFIRQHNEMLLTPAGQDYIKTAEQIMWLKKMLYNRLQANSGRLQISLGVSSRWGLDLLSQILPHFQNGDDHSVTFHVVDGLPLQLFNKLRDKSLDMAIITAEQPNQYPESRLLFQEEIVLAIPHTCYSPEKSHAQKPSNAASILSQFAKLPFILAEKGTSLRTSEDDFFLSNGLVPEVVCEIGNMTGALHLVSHGIGCSFIPDSRKDLNLPVSYFSASPKMYRYHVLIARRQIYEQPFFHDFWHQLNDAVK